MAKEQYAVRRSQPDGGPPRITSPKSVILLVLGALVVVAVLAIWLQPSQKSALLDFAQLRSGWSKFLRTYQLTDEDCAVIDFAAEQDGEGRFLAFEMTVLTHPYSEETSEAFSLKFPGEGGTLATLQIDVAQADTTLAEVKAISLLDRIEDLSAAGFLPEKVPLAATVMVRLDGMVRHVGEAAWEESASRRGITLLDGRCLRLNGTQLSEQEVDMTLATAAQPLSVQIHRSDARGPTPGPVVLVDVELVGPEVP